VLLSSCIGLPIPVWQTSSCCCVAFRLAVSFFAAYLALFVLPVSSTRCAAIALDACRLVWSFTMCARHNHGQTLGSRCCLVKIVQAAPACKGSSVLQQLTVLCPSCAALATCLSASSVLSILQMYLLVGLAVAPSVPAGTTQAHYTGPFLCFARGCPAHRLYCCSMTM
jgi:hypothetical protein